MRNSWLIARFKSRRDSEHVQAFLRLAIATPMALLLMVFGVDAVDGTTARKMVGIAIALEFALAFIILAWIAAAPGISHVRRSAGIVADIGTSCLALAALGIDAAPLWGVCLWVIVGNGLRFGPGYLTGTMAVALAFFGAVILFNDEWRAHPVLAATLWCVLGAVPAYLRRLVRSLTEARDAADRANAAKTWFLASTSHELRTPLNGVVTAVELLRTTAVSREQEQLVAAALQGARALQGLVGDILDISAIEHGTLKLSSETANPREIAKNVAMMLAAQARDKGIGLDLSAADDVPAAVKLDPRRTQQALLNLAHNAVKFTDSGSVTIQVSVEPGPALKFEVRDTGIGIPAETLPRIFEAFTQAETGAHRRHGGTGIGTTIAKELVERMGGRMFAESALGVGSCFWFTLPLVHARLATVAEYRAPAPTPGQRIADHRRRFAPKRILVVDDLASNRDVLGALLQRAGHEVIDARSAVEALELLSTSRFHAVIADWHMPGVTGHYFLIEIKAGSHPARPVPVIVLTADATVRTQDRAYDAGAHAFLTKPISVPGLLDALQAVFLETRARPVRPESPEPSADETPVLDDAQLEELRETGVPDATIARLVKTALQDLGRAMAKAQEAALSRNTMAFVDYTHAMKGVAGNIGATRMAAAADAAMREAPSHFRRGGDTELLEPVLRELAQLARAVADRFPGQPPT